MYEPMCFASVWRMHTILLLSIVLLACVLYSFCPLAWLAFLSFLVGFPPPKPKPSMAVIVAYRLAVPAHAHLYHRSNANQSVPALAHHPLLSCFFIAHAPCIYVCRSMCFIRFVGVLSYSGIPEAYFTSHTTFCLLLLHTQHARRVHTSVCFYSRCRRGGGDALSICLSFPLPEACSTPRRLAKGPLSGRCRPGRTTPDGCSWTTLESRATRECSSPWRRATPRTPSPLRSAPTSG